MAMGNVTDELILFEKIKAGEIKSFEVLFDQYYKPLCNFAYLFLRNKEQSEEIVSDLFINIWLKRDDIFIHKSLKAFLYKSTHNAVISIIRKHKQEFVYDLSSVIKRDPRTPESLLLNKEFEAAINNLLDDLPKMAGLVLRLKKIDGLKYREIAEILNISEKTVENHIIIAIQKLRQILAQKPEILKYFKLH
jgi:RNA polymerase sigma-70 factor (ECF subfamily)